jgi:hypothetical protein
MDFFDFLTGRKVQKSPAVSSIMPAAAVTEIEQGRLPHLNANTIFLKNGEVCHYIDKAILIKDRVKRTATRTGGGYSIPGFFKGMRIYRNRGKTNYDEYTVSEQFRGILYITNKRIIFQANKNGFDKGHTSLSSMAPYANAVELQYGSTNYTLLVADGNLVHKVVNIIRN